MPAHKESIIALESAMRAMAQTIKRPQTWATLTARAGLSIDRPGATILRILASQPGTWRLHDLAERIGVEAPSITRKTQQLEQAGLLGRERDPQDGRAFSVQVTPAGRVIAMKLEAAQRHVLEEALKDWPAADLAQFVNLFQRFSENFGQPNAPSSNKPTRKD